jgi:hypothetical protein
MSRLIGRAKVAAVLHHALRPGDDRLPRAAHEIGGLQLPFRSEADDDHRLGPRQRAAAHQVAAPVDEDLMCARRLGIHAHRQRLRHGAADQGIHGQFGSGEARRAVVADQQRLGFERQVAVDDGDAQRLL